MSLFFAIIVAFAICLSFKIIENDKSKQNDNVAGFFMLYVESANDFSVKHNGLGCSYITAYMVEETKEIRINMLVNEGFNVNDIKEILKDDDVLMGIWNVETNGERVWISVRAGTYLESNKHRWYNDIKELVNKKHPEWKIDKVYNSEICRIYW